MTTPWVIFVSASDAWRIAELRNSADVRAAAEGNGIWVRGSDLTPQLAPVLTSAASGPVYRIDDQDRLIPRTRNVPVRRLPQLVWASLADVIHVRLPTAAIPQIRLRRVPLQLVRTHQQQELTYLVTCWNDFHNWAILAPEIRLQACRFCVIRDSELTAGGLQRSAGDSSVSTSDAESGVLPVLIRGNPIPPLPGIRYWSAGRIVLPGGWTWQPAVDSATLEQILMRGELPDEKNTDSRELFVWRMPQNRVLRISDAAFLPAARSNLRATQDELASSHSLPPKSDNSQCPDGMS